MPDLHPCKGNCGRDIHPNYNYCTFCRSKLNKQGLCGFCGEKPRDPSSIYCAECKDAKYQANLKYELENRRPESPVRKGRPFEARENTRETKFGTGH